MRYSIALFFLAFFCTIQNVEGQDISSALYSYINAAAKNGELNGNILIAGNGQVFFQKSFGSSDFSKPLPNSDSTLFQLASISKTFTAVAVLQLMEAGKLQLDDPFSKYVSTFPYPTITIRQLLSHTSGIPDKEQLFDSILAKNPQKIVTPADIIPALTIFKADKELVFLPGERWGYTSIGYSLLALLVEKIAQEDFVSYVRKHIFLPAGMKNSYVQISLSQVKEPLHALNYQYNNHFERKLQQMDTLADWKEWTFNLTGLYGGNNVVSSTGDLLLYDRALYTDVLLKQSTLELAFTPVKLNNGENNKAAAGSSCGLGWFIFDSPVGKIVWHSGANPGVTTLFARNLSKKQSYIILQNVTAPAGVYTAILDIVKGMPRTYRQSAAFAYAKVLYRKGADYALAHLHNLVKDTLNYSLVEAEMDRVGLEFSRTANLSQLCLEAYKINTVLFPASWNALNNYANAVWKKTGNKEAAILLYQKAAALNPGNERAKNALKELQ